MKANCPRIQSDIRSFLCQGQNNNNQDAPTIPNDTANDDNIDRNTKKKITDYFRRSNAQSDGTERTRDKDPEEE